jgi:hypothetical protein
MPPLSSADRRIQRLNDMRLLLITLSVLLLLLLLSVCQRRARCGVL